MSRLTKALAVALLVVAGPIAAAAHERSVSYSTWILDEGGAEVRARLSERNVARLLPAQAGAALGEYLAGRLRLMVGAEPCVVAAPPMRVSLREGWQDYRWRVDCGASSGRRSIAANLLFDVAPSHLHFVRVEIAGQPVVERVLSSERRLWRLDEHSSASGDGASGGSFASYLGLGIEHIAGGYDHLVFVLGLILLCGSLSELAILVTGFTLAHSLTLGLGALGLLHPNPAVVEALIGFSIALVGAENAWQRGGRPRVVPAGLAAVLLCTIAAAALSHGEALAAALVGAVGMAMFCLCYFALLARSTDPVRVRTLVAFCFGLVHGLGFAAAMAELKLPLSRLLAALLGFNLGVETGQLLFIAAVWPLLQVFARLRPVRLRALVVELASASICATGLFWFVLRSLR